MLESPRGLACLAPADRLRLQRGAEHLHHLGVRAVAEFMLEFAALERPTFAALLDMFDDWRTVTPEKLGATGGDRFAPELQRVPPDLAR